MNKTHWLLQSLGGEVDVSLPSNSECLFILLKGAVESALWEFSSSELIFYGESEKIYIRYKI